MKIDQIAKVLADIQAKAPKNILKRIVEEVPITPTIEFVMIKALESPDIPEEKKVRIRTLLQNGDFSKKKFSENQKYAKMYDQYIEREINKAIKEKRLPPRSKLKDIKEIREIYEKVYRQEDKRKD